MSISLYDVSITSYLQTLGGLVGLLDKAQAHFAADGTDLADVVETRLAPDMKPFRFQIRSVAHHSVGALEGLRSGTFAPPGPAPAYTYAELQTLLVETRATLEAVSAEEVDALASRTVIFTAGDLRLPFTAANFILSFSLPNFHFHAATAYDLLRLRGVPLEKRDYLGKLRFERMASQT